MSSSEDEAALVMNAEFGRLLTATYNQDSGSDAINEERAGRGEGGRERAACKMYQA